MIVFIGKPALAWLLLVILLAGVALGCSLAASYFIRDRELSRSEGADEVRLQFEAMEATDRLANSAWTARASLHDTADAKRS